MGKILRFKWETRVPGGMNERRSGNDIFNKLYFFYILGRHGTHRRPRVSHIKERRHYSTNEEGILYM